MNSDIWYVFFYLKLGSKWNNVSCVSGVLQSLQNAHANLKLNYNLTEIRSGFINADNIFKMSVELNYHMSARPCISF